jgi:peptide/nickel transport system permease protein
LSKKSKVPFRLVRFKRFMFTLLGNRMALTGFILLILFSGLALSAPFLTPYNPQGTVVSATFDPPTWLTYFTGSTGLSQNIAFSGVAVNGSSSTSVTVNALRSDGADFTATTGGRNGTVTIYETLNYPYDGTPKRFVGNVLVTAPFANLTNSLGGRVEFYRYSAGIITKNCTYTPFTSGIHNPLPTSPVTGIDSQDQNLVGECGLANTGLNPAQIIFDTPGRYIFALVLSLPAIPTTQSISIQNFHLVLYGNTWGLLGTDSNGFDVFTQLSYGARLSLIVGLIATGIGIGVGLLVGLLAGYLGKLVDEVLMRFTDMLLVIPSLPLLIVLVAVLGSSIWNIILVLGFLGWMGFARIIRAQVLSLRERPFIEAAKASGAGTGHILTRHIFANIVSLTYVNLALSVPSAIVGEAALSFLGLGDPTVVTWGRMLQLAYDAGATTGNLTWWWVIPPGFAIALISLAFILLGYGLDTIFNPRLRRRM